MATSSRFRSAAARNGGSYSGYAVTASTIDPISTLNNGYDFYLTITGSTLGTGSPYLGFDLTQLNNTTDTLSVSAAAAAVPEPAACLISIGIVALSARRRLTRRV